jgi:hypothetical protein
MRAASSGEPSHHSILAGRVRRADDSTHCSSGVDTEPPQNVFGMPAENTTAGTALKRQNTPQTHPKQKV